MAKRKKKGLGAAVQVHLRSSDLLTEVVTAKIAEIKTKLSMNAFDCAAVIDELYDLARLEGERARECGYVQPLHDRVFHKSLYKREELCRNENASIFRDLLAKMNLVCAKKTP